MKKVKTPHPFNTGILSTIALVLIGVSSARADYQSTVLSDTPLAYYPLNLAVDTGATASDVSGNNNPGTFVNVFSGFNNAVGPSAYITNGISFDGSSQYIDLGNVPLLNFGGPITMEAWVQPVNPSQNLGDILGKGYDGANNNYELTLRLSSSRYESVTYGPANTQGAVGGVPTTSWQYVVGTFDGTTWRIYVNGQQVGQNGDTVGAINFSDPWRIANGSASGAGRMFAGNISQVALYNYALSSGQVYTHYFAGQYGTTPNSAIPIITAQPTDQSVYAGGSVRFTVGVLSALPTTNQWFKGSSPIIGQTNSTLTLFNVQNTDVGNYSVLVGNINGTTNSAPAAVSLITPTTPTVGSSLVWNTNNSGAWDNGSSANWRVIGSSTATTFNANDSVLFDDTPGVPAAVSLNDIVSPSYVTNNSSTNNFTISGSGYITGAASLVKLGNSTLEMSTANDFTGSATIAGGTLQMDAPLSGSATSLGAETAAPIVVTNGGTLLIKATGNYPQGDSGLGLRQIVVSGSGVGGNGALRSTGNDIYHDGSPRGGLFRNLRLAGSATIGNNAGRWDLGDSGLFTVISSGGSNYNLTCLQGGYSEWHQVTIDPNLGNIDYILTSPSTWAMEGMGSSLGNPTNVLTLHSGVQMSISHGNNNDDNGYAKIIHVQSGAQFTYAMSGGAGDYYLKTSLQLDGGGQMNFYNGNGGNGTGTRLGGTVTFGGLTHISIGDSTVTLTNVISGPGGFYWDSYNNALTFAADNTYTGPSIIGNGLTLVLLGNGSISHSTLIFFGGSDGSANRLNAGGRTDGTFTLTSGQTLSGIGAISGNFVVNSGAILSPGGTNTSIGSANVVGTISANSDITLHGNTIIKLNGSGVNDMVQTGGHLTYGGTLTVANAGAPLAVGNSFQIFNASSITGSFTGGINLPTLGNGLAWDTTQLGSGTISVVAGTPSSQPVLSGPTISGGNFIFSGSNGPAGGNYVVFTTTNLTSPLGSWTPVLTNAFDNNGAFHVTNAVNPAAKSGFFLLKVQ